MVEMNIRILRTAVTVLLILIFMIAPLYGIFYGSTSAVTFGNSTVISPLEFVLLLLGTKTILIRVFVPGIVSLLIISLFGRFLCGWICPTGLILDYMHDATAKNNKKKKPMGKNKEKYAILLAVLAASLIFNVSMPYIFSPPGIVYRITTYILHGLIGADLAILVTIFLLDYFATRQGRTWCNTLCPLGTMITILSFVNLVKPKVDKNKCINCLQCEEICPMKIPIIDANRWQMKACSKCFKCWEICPVKAIKIGIN